MVLEISRNGQTLVKENLDKAMVDRIGVNVLAAFDKRTTRIVLERMETGHDQSNVRMFNSQNG